MRMFDRRAYMSAYMKEWRLRPGNIEKERARYARDPEKYKAYKREWTRRPGNLEKNRARCERYRKANLRKRAAELVAYRADNPKKFFLYNARRRAKKKGFEFSLMERDIELTKTCPVLGIPLIYGLGKQCDNSPTLDRVDSTKGYVKGNVMVISWRANNLKSNASPEELMALAMFYAIRG